MRPPTPSAREVRWSFYLVGACALLITATICWGVVHKVNQSDDIVRIAATNADEVKRLNDQVDLLRAQLDRQAERRADANRRFRSELRAIQRQNAALIQVLRAHGIAVPQVALTSPRSGGSSGSGGGGGTRPKAPSSQHQPDPATPAPTPTPTPSDPITDLVCGLAPTLCA